MIIKHTKFFLTLMILTSMLFSLTNFVSADLDNGLIGYWGMNEGSGNNIAEQVYGINNATIQGGVNWIPGINSTATGNYTNIGDVSTLSNYSSYNFNPNSNFSISFWMNKTTTENDAGFIVKQDSESRGWVVREMGAGSITIQLMDIWPTNYFRANFPNTISSDGKWHHYTATYNGSGDYYGVKLFKDGIEQNQSTSTSAGVLNSTFNTNAPLQFGGWYYSGVYNYQLKGDLDEIGIWNRTLNSSEVQQLYNNGNGNFYPYSSQNISQNNTPIYSGFDQSLNSTDGVHFGNVTSSLFFGNLDWGYIQNVPNFILLNEQNLLNVNSSNWWNFMDGFNSTQFTNAFGKLTLSESWLNSFINSLVNYNYISNLGFYPSSNPSNYYNATTLPPQTGISFSYYNITTYDQTQTSTSANVTILTLPLTAGKNISIECSLLVDSDAVGTGIQFNSTLLGTSSRRQVIEYYSSATAQAICQGANETLLCLASGSAGPITTPTRIYIYTTQSSNGFFILDLKSEISDKSVTVRAGSWCRSIEV